MIKYFLVSMVMMTKLAMADFNINPGEQITIRCDGGGMQVPSCGPTVVSRSCAERGQFVDLILVMSDGEVKITQVFESWDRSKRYDFLRTEACN